MKIAIGADHGGFELKERVKSFLSLKDIEVKDFGTDSLESCDYPLIGREVAESVSKGECDRGILICKTGIGMSMAANKVRGVRAALCHNLECARLSREHNDANLLVLGAKFVEEKLAFEMVECWLSAEFLGGRHQQRVDEIEGEEI